MEAKLLLCCLICFPSLTLLSAQDVLTECGVPYVDPQNVALSDTLIYQEFFDDNQQIRAYHIDINAFGGQQVDQVTVFAILPDGTRKKVGKLAFGNCTSCVKGFALMLNDSVVVQRIDEIEAMELWLDAYAQPPFSLTGNLQTLTGAGRISGQLPVCATGLEVQYQIAANANNTTTQFATQMLCSEIVQNCKVELQSVLDCQNDQIALIANVPEICYPENTIFRWKNKRGWSFDSRNASLPLSGNEGWYYLEILDECCSILDSVLIERNFEVNVGQDQVICEGGTVFFEPTVNEEFQEIGDYWKNPAGEFSNFLSFELENVRLNQSGNYIFYATNLEGCTATDTVQIIVNQPILPEIEIPSFCLGDTVRFALINELDFSEYEWRNPEEASTVNVIENFSSLNEGKYSLIATDMNGCEVKKTFDLRASMLEKINIDLLPFCDSTQISLQPTEYSYQWETSESGAIITTAQVGDLLVTVSDSNGCQDVLTVSIPDPSEILVDLNITQPLCSNNATGSIELVLANRAVPTIFSIDGGATYTVNPIFSKLTPSEYDIIIQNDLGCQDTLTAVIEAPTPLDVAITPASPLNVRPFTPIELRADVIGNVQNYQWLPVSIDNGMAVVNFIATKNMDIRVVVEDEKGCKATASLPLNVKLGEIYIPNTFSPNTDGVNDRFTFYSDGQSGEIIEQLQIFDRWGNLLFQANELALNNSNLGWDGKKAGRDVLEGIYVYKGIVRFGNESRKKFKGNVTLTR